MIRKLFAALVLVAGLAFAGSVQAQSSVTGASITCGADNIAATLTELAGCSAPVAPSGVAALRYYITSVVAQSTTATGGQFILRSGTGTNCGTGTTSVLPSAASAARLAAAANTVAATSIVLSPPLAVTPGHAICVLGVATNTTTIQVSGYLAP